MSFKERAVPFAGRPEAGDNIEVLCSMSNGMSQGLDCRYYSSLFTVTVARKHNNSTEK